MYIGHQNPTIQLLHLASGSWAVRLEVLRYKECQAELLCVASCQTRFDGSYASMQAFTDANLSAPEINGDSDHPSATSVQTQPSNVYIALRQ